METLREWGLEDKVVALSFDTTAANTGRHSGACALIEKTMNLQFLHLACRHHVHEVMIGAVFSELFGLSSAPEVPLFKRFRENWESIDQDSYDLTLSTEDRLLLEGSTGTIIEFCRTKLDERQLRDDYQELLELTIIFLGGIPRRDYHFRAPGAVHHARWMSKVIYAIKVWIFRGQFRLTSREERSLKRIGLFSVRYYTKAWTEASTSVKAPLNDLQLLQSLSSYKDKDVAKAAASKLRKHIWYLSEELVAMAMFDDRLSTTTKNAIAAKVNEKASASIDRSNPPNLAEPNELSLTDFATPNTILFFEKLNLSHEFLLKDASEWPELDDYCTAKAFVSKLAVTNDNAERAVALAQAYNKRFTRQEDQLQYILQNVSEHRKKYPDARKSTVSKTMYE